MNLKHHFFCLFLILTGQLSAQKQVFFQQTYWTRAYLQAKIKPNLILHFEIDNRRFFAPSGHNQFIAHTHLHKRFKNEIELGFGGTFSKIFSQIPATTNALAVPELRIFQEISKDLYLNSKLKLIPRLRIDERFFRNTNGISLTKGFRYATRIRGRIQLQYAFKKAVLVKSGDELMFQFAKKATNYFDQNRLYCGFEHKFSKHFAWEFLYIWVYQHKQNTEIYYDRDVLRFTLYGRF
jgi:Protein of unknown function (DUF2490)